MRETIRITTFWEHYPNDNTFPQLLGGWDEILIDENEKGFEEEKTKTPRESAISRRSVPHCRIRFAGREP